MSSQPQPSKNYEEYISNPSNMEDLSGKVALVTGVSSDKGIGYWTVYGLIKKGAQCLITVRDVEKGVEVKKSLEERMEGKGANVNVLKMDNASFKSVNDCCDTIKKKHRKLDIIITNAGKMMGDYKLTEDGWEEQMQVNHLSHFLLIRNLFPLVKTAAEESDGFRPAITQVSSGVAEVGGINVHTDDLNITTPRMAWISSWLSSFFAMDMNSFRRYAQSKFCNFLCAVELADRINSSSMAGKIISNACHPGSCPTNLQKPDAVTNMGMVAVSATGHSASDGALPTLMAAVHPARTPGGFYGPKNASYGLPILTRLRNVNLKKEDLTKNLWAASEKAIGCKFDV